ncbi:MAG: DNA polymerase III subunit delta' [Acidobacteriota bacterium]
MPLSDFLGNAQVLATLQRQLAEDRLPHALLFCGLKGVGKATLARFLAKAVNCPHSKVDFCGKCTSCLRIDARFHPDVQVYEPDGQFIKIEQIRELSREAFFKPFEGRKRLFLIEQAERMKVEAANAILKTLEEPPESSHLILISDKPNDLLPTIRSRCQLYSFRPLETNVLDDILSRHLADLAEPDRKLLCRVAQGSVGVALSIDLRELKSWREEMLELLDACSQGFFCSRISPLTASLAKDKRNFERKSEVLFQLLQDLFRLSVEGETPQLIHADLRGRLSQLSARLPLNRILDAVKVLDHIELGAKRNINRALALDYLAIQLGGGLSGQGRSAAQRLGGRSLFP